MEFHDSRLSLKKSHETLVGVSNDVLAMARYIDRLEADLDHIKALLARFAAAPISISSIQPLLELNDQLNGVKK